MSEHVITSWFTIEIRGGKRPLLEKVANTVVVHFPRILNYELRHFTAKGFCSRCAVKTADRWWFPAKTLDYEPQFCTACYPSMKKIVENMLLRAVSLFPLPRLEWRNCITMPEDEMAL